MPTEEKLPNGYLSLLGLMQERLGVEPARMRYFNNRGLSDARLIELMQASLREGKPHQDLKVMRAGAMDDPRIQVD